MSCLLASFQNQLKFQAAIGTLQAVSVPIVEDDICKEYFPLKSVDNICAGEEGKSLHFELHKSWKVFDIHILNFQGKILVAVIQVGHLLQE